MKWSHIPGPLPVLAGHCAGGMGRTDPQPPGMEAVIWDKALHFTAYFGLAGLATVALDARKQALWAVLSLAILGGVLEILQGFTGRDPSLYDEVANILGAGSGGCCGWLAMSLLQSKPLVPGPRLKRRDKMARARRDKTPLPGQPFSGSSRRPRFVEGATMNPLRFFALCLASVALAAAAGSAADTSSPDKARKLSMRSIPPSILLTAFPMRPAAAKYAPFISAALDKLLADGNAAEIKFNKANKDSPPLIEGDLFTSMFEGATS